MPIMYDLRKDIRFKEGLETKARTSAIRMLNHGVPIKSIVAFLDVTTNFVLNLQKELGNKSNPQRAKKDA